MRTPFDRVERDREHAEEEHEEDLGRGAQAEGEDDERGERDLGDRIERPQERRHRHVEEPRPAHREADGHPHDRGERHADDEVDEAEPEVVEEGRPGDELDERTRDRRRRWHEGGADQAQAADRELPDGEDRDDLEHDDEPPGPTPVGRRGWMAGMERLEVGGVGRAGPPR